jgi:hypothetical protein
MMPRSLPDLITLSCGFQRKRLSISKASPTSSPRAVAARGLKALQMKRASLRVPWSLSLRVVVTRSFLCSLSCSRVLCQSTRTALSIRGAAGMMRMIRRWLTSRSGKRCPEQATIIMLLGVPTMVGIKGIEREMG